MRMRLHANSFPLYLAAAVIAAFIIITSFFPVSAAIPADFGLREGDIISVAGSDDPDIYIINGHGYKRLFLNPAIFNFYGHLRWENVRTVDAPTRDAFITSGLFRNCEAGDSKVWGVEVNGEDTGVLHWVNVPGAQAVLEDSDFFKKVFCINTAEFNWYQKAADYTSIAHVPPYGRIKVDLKANDQDGTITVPFNTPATLSWTSRHATSCTASGGWTGSKLPSGSETTPGIVASATYVLVCTGSAGSARDSLTIVPGASNQVAMPMITPNGGTFTTEVEVTLATTTAGADIRYTTDGSTPIEASLRYAAPFILRANTGVKARAFKAGMTESAVASASFVVVPPIVIFPPPIPPTVSVSHTPLEPKTTDKIIITASAADTDGVQRIDVYVDGSIKKQCMQATSCATDAAFYTAGIHTYFAKAVDSKGHEGQSISQNFSVTQAPSPELTRTVFAYYYGWYGGAPAYQHWSSAGRIPPNDIDPQYYPTLGAYDGSSDAVLDWHMKWFQFAKIDVVLLSYWGINHPWSTDDLVRKLLDKAHAYGLKVAFVMEPKSVEDHKKGMLHIIDNLANNGTHPGLYKVARPTKFGSNPNPRPLFMFYNWALHYGNNNPGMPIEDVKVLYRNLFDSLRGTPYDGFFLTDNNINALVLDPARVPQDASARFDLTNFHSDGSFAYAADAAIWTGKTFAESPDYVNMIHVAPGFDNFKIESDSQRRHQVDRRNGAQYDDSWREVASQKPDWVAILSFNEWGENSQIEPAANVSIAGQAYRNYVGHFPGLSCINDDARYLCATIKWVDQYKQAPDVPVGLVATPVSSSQINLSWSAVTSGATGYHVYRGGVRVATVTGTTHNDIGLAPSTAYSYTVASVDAAGNVSAQSSPVSGTTFSAPANAFTCDFNTFEPITDGTSYVGDPNIVKLDELNVWAMAYGKLEPTSTVNQYSAYLPPGNSLGADKSKWVFNQSPIVPLVPGAWDATNIETGSYVRGWTPSKLSDGLPGWEERIYYAGRNYQAISPEAGFPIGVLYKDAAGIWKRYSTYVYYPTEWWETGYGIGEPAMHYEPGTGTGGTNGTWHLYYQACTHKGLANGYPIADECFIAHRKSSDGVRWTLVPSSTTGKPWIVAGFMEFFKDAISITLKPEIKVDSAGGVHWVATDGSEKITYARPADLNSSLIRKEVLFTINDCKNNPARRWCNGRFETGHSFDFDPDGSIWVYFSVSECSVAGCPAGATETWRIARVHCPKTP